MKTITILFFVSLNLATIIAEESTVPSVKPILIFLKDYHVKQLHKGITGIKSVKFVLLKKESLYDVFDVEYQFKVNGVLGYTSCRAVVSGFISVIEVFRFRQTPGCKSVKA